MRAGSPRATDRVSTSTTSLSNPLVRHRRPPEREQTSLAVAVRAVRDKEASEAYPTPTKPLERPGLERCRLLFPGRRDDRSGPGEQGSRVYRDGAYTTTKPNPRRCQPVEDPRGEALRRHVEP